MFLLLSADNSPVMRGLDPRIHQLRKNALRRWTDCRVISAFTRVFRRAMPGNDDLNVAPACLSGDDMFLLSQPFEQRRNVDLVGLVVAGERVHHDVDTGAERE